ncbi:MAG: DUF2244 domain-containing protein [Alphaproteobacteria bacterium]
MPLKPDSSREKGAAPVYFSATLYPHRSLGPRGFMLVMLAVAGFSFAAGLGFFLAGAWPVIGFLGLDVALLYWAFKATYRRGRQYETVHLTDDALKIVRIGPGNRMQAWRFQPYWVQVALDDPPEHDSMLELRSHGRALVIGSFLAADERKQVAQSLRAALRRVRNAAP